LSIPGSGQTIMIKHGEYFSVYGRIENVEVAPGTKVLTGQKLGTVMEVNENNSIDFQIWHKQENQNPESWLTK
jgi:murein hydrolase activator